MTDFKHRAAEVFDKAPFIVHLGAQLVDAGEGWVETALELTPEHRQQHGYAHAGVVATLADHTAGAAASTVVDQGRSVLTADYTLHLLRPGAAESLTCKGEIVKAGRMLIITQADVWADGKLCARYTGSMAVVDRSI